MTKEAARPRDRESWDQRYVDDALPWDRGTPDPHLQKVIEQHGVGAGKALDIGCGTGTNALWLAERGFEVSGLDISPTAIARARDKVAAAGIRCQLFDGDFLADPIPGAPFDFVYDRGCFHVFDSADQRARFAAHVADLLGSEGIWHSLAGSTDGPPRDTGPPRLSAADIVAALEPRFEILELRSTRFDPEHHAEVRAWVLVARKRTFYPVD